MSQIELAQKGLWKGCFDLDNEKKLEKFAFVWVDRDWRYFILDSSSLKPGMPYSRDRIRQLGGIPNSNTFCFEFEINQPRMAEIYYSRNPKIDESNHTRQDDFRLERKLQTKDCIIRVNTSIIGTNYVDTYYFCRACEWWYDRNPVELY